MLVRIYAGVSRPSKYFAIRIYPGSFPSYSNQKRYTQYYKNMCLRTIRGWEKRGYPDSISVADTMMVSTAKSIQNFLCMRALNNFGAGYLELKTIVSRQKI